MGDLVEEAAEEDQAAESAPADAEDTAVDELEWPPRPLVRTSVATTQASEAFGPMVAAEARARNFDRAERKAFVADGGKWIWSIQKVYFRMALSFRKGLGRKWLQTIWTAHASKSLIHVHHTPRRQRPNIV